MSGSQRPGHSQHPEHRTNRASTNYTGPSDMNVTDPHIHELQARLAYQELISPPRTSQSQSSRAFLGHSSAPGVAGHHQSHLQGPQPGHTHGTSWGSHTAIQPQYQGFGTHSGSVHDYQDPRTPSTMHAQSSESRHSSPQSPLSPAELSIEEDKRRRNTEASARFRAKKKERLQNMEKTMSDLQRKAEDLEKEAGELRRENSWLKEMVIMKGKRRGTLGQDLSGQGSGKHDDDIDESDGSDGERH